MPLAALGFSVLALCLENGASAERGRGRAFWAAFFFAYGYFVAGMYWTGISFLVDARRFAVLLPLPVLGLPLLLALFPALGVWGVQGWLGQALNGGRWLLPIRLALGWSVGEQVRSHILTGLPWNLVGYVWTFSDAMIQPAAWIGAQGLSLLTVMLLAAPALLIDRKSVV